MAVAILTEGLSEAAPEAGSNGCPACWGAQGCSWHGAMLPWRVLSHSWCVLHGHSQGMLLDVTGLDGFFFN